MEHNGQYIGRWRVAFELPEVGSAPARLKGNCARIQWKLPVYNPNETIYPPISLVGRLDACTMEHVEAYIGRRRVAFELPEVGSSRSRY